VYAAGRGGERGQAARAVATLADNLTALAGTVAEADGHLRARLALDAPVIEHQAEGNGTGRRGRKQPA
jgi:hypothetical protein